MILYLDLDGVLCNLEDAAIRAGGMDPARDPARPYALENFFESDDAFWAAIERAGGEEVFASLEKYPWTDELLRAAQETGHELRVLSKVGGSKERGFAEAIERGKRRWCAEHLPFVAPEHVIIATRHKHQAADARTGVLLDDLSKNVDRWTAAGGTGVLFPRFPMARGNIAEWVGHPRIGLRAALAQATYIHERKLREDKPVTDKLRVLNLFSDLGIGHAREEGYLPLGAKDRCEDSYLQSGERIVSEFGDARVIGMTMQFVEFYFDGDGKFVQMGLWE